MEKRTSCSADQGVYLPDWPTPTMIVDGLGHPFGQFLPARSAEDGSRAGVDR
jgi:hypothetical protein